MGLLRDLGVWLWRLLPANPILVRVVSTGGKRIRHLWARLIYLAALAIVVWIGGGLLTKGGSLADLAKNSTQTFMWVSMMQLFLMSFIAPVFCAGAITQEKDANTYHILLTTPLSNAQIVLGSLFSRIYFVWVLLLAGLPIFCITMIYGGVTTAEVFQSFGLAACTGLVTGSVAIMISFLKIGTRRTIFSFFVGVAVYLLGIGAIGLSPVGALAAAAPGPPTLANTSYQMSWLAPVHPFLALMVVIGWTPAPPLSDVYAYGWPARWLLAYPEYGYMVVMTLASVLMIGISLFWVRRGAKEGEGVMLARVREFVLRQQNGERRRKPRRVWRNPIAWREAATRASAGGRSTMRWIFAALGVLVGLLLLIAHTRGWWGFGPAAVPLTRGFVTALVWIELAVILLVVTNTAASTLTREKESLTIELLLTTPLTSDYIVAGMLQGLVRFVIPLVAVPTITIVLFSIADFFRGPKAAPVTTLEAALLVPLLTLAFAAFAAVVGLHFSLQAKKTVQAVMISTAVVMGATGLLWACGYALERSNTSYGVNSVLMPLLPFPAMKAAVDPWSSMGRPDYGYGTPGAAATFSTADEVSFRVARTVFSAIAIAVYGAVAYSLYKNLKRNFDMTVRKQSA